MKKQHFFKHNCFLLTILQNPNLAQYGSTLEVYLIFLLRNAHWKNAFLQQLLVRIYQKADRRCHIAREFVIFAMVHLFRIKSLLRFKHCLIPKIKTKWLQWPHHSSGWFRQLRKQKGAMLAKKSVLAIKFRSVDLFILHVYVQLYPLRQTLPLHPGRS